MLLWQVPERKLIETAQDLSVSMSAASTRVSLPGTDKGRRHVRQAAVLYDDVDPAKCTASPKLREGVENKKDETFKYRENRDAFTLMHRDELVVSEYKLNVDHVIEVQVLFLLFCGAKLCPCPF
jgi:hypothetical protein